MTHARRRHARAGHGRRAARSRSTTASGCGSTRSGTPSSATAPRASRRSRSSAPPGPSATGAIDPLERDRRPLRGARASGSTWTARTAARRSSPTTCGRCSPASSAPTRSRSTRTSGCTSPLPAAASSCATCSAGGLVHAGGELHVRGRRTLGHPVGLRDFGPQFSRGFQALKVWVSLLAHGRRAYAARISHDAALARYLGDAGRGARRLRAVGARSGCRSAASATCPPDLPPAGAPGARSTSTS